MLSKPYKKIAEEGSNNYYLLNVGDTFFVATESIIPFGKKEFTQGLKLMPLYAPVMMLFVEMMNMKKIDEKVIEDLGKEEFFEEINVKKVREKIAKLTNTVTEESVFDYTTEIKSFALRRFVDEGDYELLAVEKKSHYRRNVWLAKSDKFGTLTVSVAGVLGNETQKFSILETFIFNKEIISQVLIESQKMQLKQKKAELKAMKKLQKKFNKTKKVEEKK